MVHHSPPTTPTYHHPPTTHPPRHLHGPELLPFYGNRKQEATFTVLHGILVGGFYRFTAGSKFAPARAPHLHLEHDA